MWRIANKSVSDTTPEQIGFVRNQVMKAIDIFNLNNQQRQEKAAYLMYDLIFANEAYEGSRKENNLKQIQEDSDMVYNLIFAPKQYESEETCYNQ